MQGEGRSLIWEIRQGEAKADCPRASLQLEAGDADLGSSCDTSRGHLRCHISMMGTSSWGP